MLNPIIDSLNVAMNIKLPTHEEAKEQAFEELAKQTGFNVNSWHEIVDLQKTLNDTIDPNWISKKHNWRLAILLENGELLDSIHWKWWKDGKTDWANLKIEMIDLIHFLLAWSIETKSSDMIIPYIASKELNFKNNPIKVELNEELALKVQSRMFEFVSSLITNNLLSCLMTWIDVWFSMGLNTDELFKQYKMKYTLNNFRQDHGYKDGTYIKIWNGKEDNVYAQEFLPNDYKTYIDDLYQFLETTYSTLIAPVDKDLKSFTSSSEKWNAFFVNVPTENRKVMMNFAQEYANYLKS